MLRKIDLKSIRENPFSLIGDRWMLVTAGTGARCNTMTASWGGLGVLWETPVATIYIRPQRYTYEFVENSPCFTLGFFGEKYRSALALCGSKSGRDVDKIKACGFTVAEAECGAPYFQQADLVLVCRKLYWQDIDPAHFTDRAVDAREYPNHDYHRMFIGEVVEALGRE